MVTHAKAKDVKKGDRFTVPGHPSPFCVAFADAAPSDNTTRKVDIPVQYEEPTERGSIYDLWILNRDDEVQIW